VIETPMTGHTNGASDKSMQALMERLDLRLARLEDAVARLDGLARGAPALVATVADVVDGIAARLGDRGVDMDERVRAVTRLTERVTSAASLHAIEALVDRLGTFESALRLADHVPGSIATITDIVDELAARLADEGTDVDARVQTAVRLLERLTAPRTSAALETLLDSGALDERALGALARLAEALGAAGETAAPAVGAWGAFRALGDPDIQRALGFLLAIAKELGRALAIPLSPKQLPTSSKVG
jgi:uncharacterized protein YjgD (DUF1641 family)